MDGLLDRFAPYRQVQLELEEPATAEQLARFGEVEAIEGRKVRLIVRREDLPRHLSQLLADFAILDLTVTDPPVEEIIGRVFTAGVVT